jgi:hypothetical protein
MAYLVTVTVIMLDGNEVWSKKKRLPSEQATSPIDAGNRVYAFLMDTYGLKQDQISKIESEVVVLCG